ncbi:DNA-directed RNA polymerase I subunit RPA34 [Taeniopygia guttata]|uniref:DNA-directed RNA polymerase I subunit RPA34 n=1 Tax=Taeniopygia guttata TaxID=59729 RepID=UPI003BB8E968
MNGPPPRFRCPPEFEAEAGGVTVTPGGPQAELWLIRAPADFCPQSLEGCPVPLDGLERLRPPGDGDSGDSGDTGDTGELWVLRGGPGTGDCPLLLSPMSPGGALGCAPPLRGSLSIARSFGGTPGTARVAPGDTEVAPGDARTARVALGDTKMALGDTEVAPGDTKMTPGDTKMAPGDTEVASGDTEMAPGDTEVAPGDTGTICFGRF